MRLFFTKTIIFSLCILFMLIIAMLCTHQASRQKKFFELPPHITGLILGNSHASCGFDARYIDGFVNLGESAEPMLFSYLKLKEFTKASPNIKTVLLEFGNPHLNNEIISSWLASCQGLEYYQPYLSIEETSYLFNQNPIGFVSIQPKSIREHFIFNRTAGFRFGSFEKIGKNKRFETSIADSLLKLKSEVVPLPADTGSIHKHNFQYLLKIIEYCKSKKIQLVLIRMPVLKAYRGWADENTFQQIVSERLKEVDFIDLQDFPLTTKQFHDLDHLNTQGSKMITTFLSHAINDGLLKEKNMQLLINSRIDSIR